MWRDSLRRGVPVILEVLLFSVHAGELTFRSVRRALARGQRPDLLAAHLAGVLPQAVPPGVVLLHSTSWRFDDDGTVVLTYAGLPDPDRWAAAESVVDEAVAHPDDPRAPSPADLSVAGVAAHAARHLAWLDRTDEAVAATLDALPHFRRALARMSPGSAGALPPAEQWAPAISLAG
jgi:hypothetical protein